VAAIGTGWVDGAWIVDGWVVGAWESDTTAPVLTNPTGLSTGSTTASGTVDTDEAGTLYFYASINATETAATIKASGSSQAATTGTQSVAFTGLTAATQYYAHYVEDDGASNESNVVSSSAFTTAVASRKGGRSSRKRYVVEVDGELIQVATQADVLAVLQQASEIVSELAEQEVIPPPKIRVRTLAGKPVESKAVVAAVKRTQNRISQAHDDAKKRQEVDREISRLILMAIERQDEEDDIITMLLA
jgi:hypothetical protein